VYEKRSWYVKKKKQQDMGFFLKPSGGEPDKRLSQGVKGNPRREFGPS
jgi:hypothetical protein